MLNEIYLDKLTTILASKGIDTMFIAPSEDLEFLLGFSPHMDERFQGFFITKDKEMFYIVPKLNREEMQDTLKGKKVYDWGDGEGFLDTVVTALDDFGLKGKTIGVNGTTSAISILDIGERVDVRFVNGRPILEDLRIIKSGEELEKLRKAATIADKVFEEILGYIKPGLQEKDIKEEIQELFAKNGGDGIAFNPIVASGPNSSKPHYNQYSRYIQEKDIIILDFGCKYKGLCSDMSRTVFVGGVSEEERNIYDIVYKSQDAGEKAVKEGVTAESVDVVARNIIEEAGYGDYFLNRLGHGIGYSVHEAPDIKGGNRRVLEKGMAFSIEPGIYLPGKFGVRIENIMVIGENGPEAINKANKGIAVV
ncbi:MAG: Xaa-Pro peptidase family protein [Bacillota bacterium]|nr:Xaa-Pro peptidase family protein [Bacillota bacterium]MDD3297257.1 Xaa-Pro peptidase family protein [Bacillota bacterium]MDD3850479.1 Xaa-Pro peptidase family protein [Bacillota bacterium]MDD4708028.1 Xaa-Pro peptidase family protein [Bacillota bacterium]